MAVIDRPARGSRASSRRAPRLAIALTAAALVILAPSAWSQADGQRDGQSDGQSSLGALHHALHLSAGQEGAWQAYRAQTLMPSGAQDRRRAAAAMFPTLRAPQRMDLVEAETREELGELHRQAQALNAFYEALSPGQQAVFDAQTLPADNQQQQEQ